MTYDHDARRIDPRQGDGLYHGPSSGHLNLEKASNIGMGGMYGYGASMNAWHVDYVAYWAGHNGFIWHSQTQFRSPAFEGDITYIDGEVTGKKTVSRYACQVVGVQGKTSTKTVESIPKGNPGGKLASENSTKH